MRNSVYLHENRVNHRHDAIKGPPTKPFHVTEAFDLLELGMVLYYYMLVYFYCLCDSLRALERRERRTQDNIPVWTRYRREMFKSVRSLLYTVRGFKGMHTKQYMNLHYPQLVDSAHLLEFRFLASEEVRSNSLTYARQRNP